MTNADRIKWIAENINYMEHNCDNDASKYNFWPHEDSDPHLLFDEKCVGMSLIEYIDYRIGERK